MNVVLAIFTPDLANTLSFGVRIMLTSNHDASRAFPSLTPIQLLQPLFSPASFAFISFADAAVAARRLNPFFRLPDVQGYIEELPVGSDDKKPDAGILDDAFSWFITVEGKFDPDDDGGSFKSIIDDCERDEKTVLDQVGFNLQQSTVTLLVGRVGSGNTFPSISFVNGISEKNGSAFCRGWNKSYKLYFALVAKFDH